jgi:hypothetical protein
VRRTAAAILPALFTVAAVLVTGAPAAQAASPEFAQCPAIGFDTGCAALITVNPDGTSAVGVDSSQSTFNGLADTLVGVVNDGTAPISGLALSGPLLNQGMFAFDGHGLCVAVTGQAPPPEGCPFGTTGYEGPGTSFTVNDPDDGIVNFTSGLAPGATAYFSVHGIVNAQSLKLGGITVAPVPVPTGVPVSAQATVPFSGPVATFTDADSTLGAGDFAATVDWGDGSGVDATPTVTESAGTFTVNGTHTYAASGPFAITVTITDAHGVTVSTATTASVSSAPITCIPGETCSGSVSQDDTTTSISGTSNTPGIIDLALGQTQINCNDNDRHAPLMTTITENGTSGKGFTVLTSFPKSEALGPPNRPIAVCFSSTVKFRDRDGKLVLTGDLRTCKRGSDQATRPCVAFIVGATGIITEKLLVPAQDPRYW